MNRVTHADAGQEFILTRPAAKHCAAVEVLVKTTGRQYVDDAGQVLSVQVRLPDDADDVPSLKDLRTPFVSPGMLRPV